MDDERRDEIQRAVGAAAASIMEALELPEVEEALEDWSRASFTMIRAYQRAGLDPDTIGSIMGGGVLQAILKIVGDEE